LPLFFPRRLDPSGLTLDAVSERVRAYLKLRPDTVKQIVTTLTDPDSSDLLEPVGGGGAAEVVQEAVADGDMAPDPDESRGDEAAMLRWEPEPVTADGASSGGAAARRAPDVLAILVQIYGSKATFVNEFRKMLSEKLLASASHDTEKEVRNLELLKKRFGDAALSACEVMLTDVAESRRISRSIQQHFGGVSGGGEGATLIDATVVSRLCWPSLPTDSFTLPAGVKKEMARFEKQFAHIKAPRKLVWKPSLGTVTLDVIFPRRQRVRAARLASAPPGACIGHFPRRQRRRRAVQAAASDDPAAVRRAAEMGAGRLGVRARHRH